MALKHFSRRRQETGNTQARFPATPGNKRGVTLLTHTSGHYLRFYQQAIPCKLREATFNLDGLIEHDTELDPKTCFTGTHGYTEVVMATAALLGFELAPRIRAIKDQTLYKMDRQQCYPHLDPILTGTIRPDLIRQSWDAVVRVMASITSRIERLHVYYGLESLEVVSAHRNDPSFKMLVGRLHKAGVSLRVLQQTFQSDAKSSGAGKMFALPCLPP
ncbi:MAG: Tn3 family transposase [Verrucomicrobiia bacterium]